MPPYAQTLTHLFALGTVGLQCIMVAATLHRLWTGTWVPQVLTTHVRTWALPLAAVLPVAGLVLSLFYSEVVGLPVCALCWFGRTMMYPLAFIMPIAAWRGDRDIWRYVLPLATVGAIVSGYQHLLQMGTVTGSACHVIKNSGDCAARYVFEFDYITMPLFGFTVFVAVALLVWIARSEALSTHS